MTEEPKWDGPHESRAEEVIDWYQHHMAVHVEVLLAEYHSKNGSKDHEPSTPLEMAVEARSEEIVEFVTEGDD